jgi:hypothetical protein
MRLDSHMRKHNAGDGFFAAAKTLFDGVPKILTEFKNLNTREARAAFADHWIGIWARDFDESWTVIYELLKIIEEDELYKDPRRVGPQAPGFPQETHGQHSSYPDFAAYFTDRVKQPLNTWAELERTYRYAQRYAPEIFSLPYAEATQKLRDGPGRPLESERDNSCNARISPGQNTNAAYICSRLERDSKCEDLPPERRERVGQLLSQVETGKLSANAAAIEAGFRQRMIQHPPTVEGFKRAATRCLTPEDRCRLKEEL